MFGYIDGAVSDYRVGTNCELHALEKELRERSDFKGPFDRKAERMSELKGRCDLEAPLLPGSCPLTTMAAIVPISSYPWYESDWVLFVSFSVIVLGAVYFLTKKGDDDDGSGLSGAIKSDTDRGLLDLLPKKENLSAWEQ